MKTLPIYFLVDVSGSMDWKNKIDAANKALRYAIPAMREQAQKTQTCCLVRLIEFEEEVTVHDFEMIETFEPPTLRTGSSTNMIGALRQTLRDIENDLADSSYFMPPLIILLTDGEHDYVPEGYSPFDLSAQQGVSEFMAYLDEEFLPAVPDDSIRVAIAIGEDAQKAPLTKFVSEGVKVLKARNAEDLVEFVTWTQNAIGGGVTGLLETGVPKSKGASNW